MAQLSPAIERGPSTLASNNPFRNRVSPTTASPSLSTIGLATTTNPFLDASEVASPDPARKSSPTAPGAQPKSAINNTTATLFAGLDINDTAKPRVREPPLMKGPPRRENVPPPHGRPPPPRHKLSASDEERRRQHSKNRGQPRELDIFADPPDVSRPREKRPQRRNSESSIREKPKDMDPEAEKRRRERRLREGKSSSKSKQASRKLDIIDKLDVTSIYGTGLFHHDGPFDACNPHRNRKGSRQAPMQAFPKNSTNMQLGGSGPVNAKLNLDQYHGTEREAHNDYNEAAIVEGEEDYYRRPQPERSASFNPTARIEPVHGSLTAGLGTSTFLEGAPASRAAIQRRESEYEASQREANANGLSRTKSLAQRIKSVRPKVTDGPRVNSPELAATPTSPMGSGRPDQNGTNPFFKDYDKDYEKKGAQIAFAEEQQKPGRARAPSSPKRGLGLERKLTADSANPEESKPSTGGGFLTRMKSLKTPRRPRERRNTETLS